MSDMGLFRAAVRRKPVPRLGVPVKAPQYQYLVCDLMTDQLLANVPLTGVTFDRRVSRVGSFGATWRIPDRKQALLADQVSSGSGRYAIWVLRDNVVWWGGIIWTCKGQTSARGSDTVSLSAATFDSYLDHRFLDGDWFASPDADVVSGPRSVWLSCQSFANSNIGVLYPLPTKYAGENPPDGVFLLWSDQKTYGDAVKLYTDSNPACQQTIDVTRGDDGSRVKTLRVEADFSATEAPNRFVLSGYRIPSWTFTRDATKAGTAFRTWGNPQESDIGSETYPRPSNLIKRQDLLDAGWPRLDVSADIGTIPLKQVDYQPVLDGAANALMDRYGGIRDVVQYEVDLAGSDWHPNMIGQNVVIKRSQKDLWRPGQTSVVAPAVVEFQAPDREQPERVTFTMDGEAA